MSVHFNLRLFVFGRLFFQVRQLILDLESNSSSIIDPPMADKIHTVYANAFILAAKKKPPQSYDIIIYSLLLQLYDSLTHRGYLFELISTHLPVASHYYKWQ